MTGVEAIAAERRRQIETEGWTSANDDGYLSGELAQAAAAYTAHAGSNPDDDLADYRTVTPHNLWPWSLRWWKPRDRRSDLVRAGALIAAEIDRIDREAERQRWKVAALRAAGLAAIGGKG